MSAAFQVSPRPLEPRSKPVRNRAYRAFVRSQPCLACGQTWRIEAAHTEPHGLQQKASDLSVVQLCECDHRTGRYALGKIGRAAFERHFQLNLTNEKRRLIALAVVAGVLEGGKGYEVCP